MPFSINGCSIISLAQWRPSLIAQSWNGIIFKWLLQLKPLYSNHQAAEPFYHLVHQLAPYKACFHFIVIYIYVETHPFLALLQHIIIFACASILAYQFALKIKKFVIARHTCTSQSLNTSKVSSQPLDVALFVN